MSHNDPRYPDRYQAAMTATIPTGDGRVYAVQRPMRHRQQRGTLIRTLDSGDKLHFPVACHRAVEAREASKYPAPVLPSAQHRANARRVRRGY